MNLKNNNITTTTKKLQIKLYTLMSSMIIMKMKSMMMKLTMTMTTTLKWWLMNHLEPQFLEIQDGTYVCLVCTGEINKDSQIWTCHQCFRVYDLDCIQDWAVRGSSTNKTSKEWRCPSCNHATKVIPKVFTCWCGKLINPEHNVLMPFSCGSMCNYKYASCVHSCTYICHPGQHPICGATGPMMKCHCGKESRQLPCLITPYDEGLEVCTGL